MSLALHQYRLTKYDPRFRDHSGAYQRDEWTSISDVGSVKAGQVVTIEEYETVEAAYINTICRLIESAEIGPFRVFDPESALMAHHDLVPPGGLGSVLKSLLREAYWCRLADADQYFIHVGYDYYIYLGLPDDLVNPQRLVSEGLFLEPFESPYHPERD